MSPSIAKYLAGAGATLGRDVAPHLSSAYARGQVGAIAMILSFAAREGDRAVDTIVKEHDALRTLFADAATAPLPDALCKRLGAASTGQRVSLRISDLERQTAPLKALLIELHEALELIDDAACAALETRIWTILKDAADARVVGVGR